MVGSEGQRRLSLAWFGALAALVGLMIVLSRGSDQPGGTSSAVTDLAETPEAAEARQRRCAQMLGAEVRITDSIGTALVLIPADNPFYLAEHEVMVGQFTRFVEATGHRSECETASSPADWRRPQGFSQSERHPVVDVTPGDAEAFCRWLSGVEHAVYRLPTSVEWEYAARAGSTAAWHFGEASLAPRFAWYGVNAGGRTHPVGWLEPNAFGLRDVHGNVDEWCVEGEPSLAGLAATEPSYVLRGGNWSSPDVETLQFDRPPDARSSIGAPTCGFRVVRELDAPR